MDPPCRAGKARYISKSVEMFGSSIVPGIADDMRVTEVYSFRRAYEAEAISPGCG
jgi:hypothetical protein